MNESRVIKSVTNECQLLGRAHESPSARAEQLIACLEGEIAKRDARIAELEAGADSLRLSRDYHHEQEVEYRRRWAGLNAATVQQVSVPDGKVCVPVEVLRLYEFMAASFTPFTSQHEQIAISLRKAKAAMLAAAPAAPAADAGIVDMYRHLQKVTPYRFKKIQDASITDGGDVMYFHKDRFDAALLADMAALPAGKDSAS